AAMPTPPSPTTATRSPGAGRPAFTTAPPPVSTAQPSSAATSGGTSASTATTEVSDTTACVANALTPRWWCTSCTPPAPAPAPADGTPRDNRRPPPTSVPAALAADPTEHGRRPSVAHSAHRPQRGRNVKIGRAHV